MKYLTKHILFCCFLAWIAPTTSLGQFAISPIWIQHAWTNENGLIVRAHDIDASQEDKVYVTGWADIARFGATFNDTILNSDSSFAFLVSYGADGTQQWVEVGAFENAEMFLSDINMSFFIEATGDRLYTGEGLPLGSDSDQLTAGIVSINSYDNLGEPIKTTLIGEEHTWPDEWPGFANGLGIDAAENIYVGGIYADTLILSSDVILAPFLESTADVFLASYTSEGVLRWGRRIGGPRFDVLAEVGDPHGAFTVDAEGNTYFGSFYSAGAVFGEGQTGEFVLTESAYALVSYDAEGQFRWVRTGKDLGISDNAGPWRLDVDPAGNLAVDWFVLSTGSTNTATVGDQAFTDPGFGGEFVTRFAPDGTLLWARQIKSDGNEIISAVTTDTQGHVYVAGQFDGFYLEIGDQRLQKNDLQADETDGFVAHFDEEGNLRWVGHAAGEETQRINAISVSPSGDLYVAGEFEGTLRLGPETLTEQTPGGLEMFVAKYDAATITANEDFAEVPVDVVLESNYPNPFHTATTIRFALPTAADVSLVVYDVLGREVATLVSGHLPAGTHTAAWNAAEMPSGLYIYRLKTGDHHLSQTMLLAK